MALEDLSGRCHNIETPSNTGSVTQRCGPGRYLCYAKLGPNLFSGRDNTEMRHALLALYASSQSLYAIKHIVNIDLNTYIQ